MKERSRIRTVPDHPGLEWLGAELPREIEPWPKFSRRVLADLTGDDYDITAEEVRAYAAGRPWVWPDRSITFLCDVHADADAFFTSLVASGGVEKLGPADTDFRLTPEGRAMTFVIGGDCFDKGPSNLRLLRALKLLIDEGADVEILAGNHDLRTLVGLTYAGSDDPRFAHLFVRMGKKSVPLFQEVWSEYLCYDEYDLAHQDEELVKRLLFPDESWYERFPDVARGLVPEKKIGKEVRRIREKVQEFQRTALEAGLTLPMIGLALQKCHQLFLQPGGEFSWFFERMELALVSGAFLFIHAGIDDAMAAVLRAEGVEGLNRRFRDLLASDPFELYHGPVGNTFRTKYRDHDLPFTEAGVADMHAAGIYAIVHGHRNILRGQRMVMRRGMLNFECDTSVDARTRRIEGLEGQGGSATCFRPDGTLVGVSTDYPYVKHFSSSDLFEVTTFV